MLKLTNSVQNYQWGSLKLLSEKFGVKNEKNLPIAELWMGAHPKGSSKIIINDSIQTLGSYIDNNKQYALGQVITERFGELPFLFKVLCAESALSIQVHPSKVSAEQGFKKEEDAKIPLNSSSRNYKDPNHKPELIYALSPFLAMNAFRCVDEISVLFNPLANAHHCIKDFLSYPNEANLERLFKDLLYLNEHEKNNIIIFLNDILPSQVGLAWEVVRTLLNEYKNDIGVLMPLLLNVIELKPGEAMFLHAETPHAYIKGLGLEVMANSDNVLRSGLTSKHIDIPELISNVNFECKELSSLLTIPIIDGNAELFPVPVDDFSFSIHKVCDISFELVQHGPVIIFCFEGEVLCKNSQGSIKLLPGDSIFINAGEPNVSFSGSGRFARAYTVL